MSPVPAGEPGSRPALSRLRGPAEKILTSRSALEGERKQVTMLFADLKGSMELLADRDPEEGRKLLDPVLERMMEAVHRYEGTVRAKQRLEGRTVDLRARRWDLERQAQDALRGRQGPAMDRGVMESRQNARVTLRMPR